MRKHWSAIPLSGFVFLRSAGSISGQTMAPQTVLQWSETFETMDLGTFSSEALSLSVEAVRGNKPSQLTYQTLLLGAAKTGQHDPSGKYAPETLPELARYATEWYWAQSKQIAEARFGRPWGELTLDERRSIALDMFLAYDRRDAISHGYIATREEGIFEVDLNQARGGTTRPSHGDVLAKVQDEVKSRREAVTRVISYIPKLFPGALPPIALLQMTVGIRYLVLSKFGASWDHELIVSRTYRPNFFTIIDFDGALEYLASNDDPNLTIGFNSWGGGGTINYLHKNIFRTHDTLLPGGARRGLPIEKFRGEPFATIGGVEVARERAGWPGHPIFLSSSDPRALATVASRLIDIHQARNISHNVNFYKEHVNGQVVYRLVFMPHEHNREAPLDMNYTAFGMLELAGRVIPRYPEEFTEATANKIAQLIDSISLSARERDEILAALLGDFQKDDSMTRVRTEQELAGQVLEDIYATLYPGDMMAGDQIKLKPDGEIPERLREIFHQNPDFLNGVFERMRLGQPLTVTAPSADQPWQPQLDVTEAVQRLDVRLRENAQHKDRPFDGKSQGSA
jgi:hypothetical protein